MRGNGAVAGTGGARGAVRCAVLAGLILAGTLAAPAAGGVANAEPTAPPPAPIPSPTPVPTPLPTPGGHAEAPRTAVDADGTYAVGTELQPGTYSSGGPADGGTTCSWQRYSDVARRAVVDSAISKRPQVVTVAPTDAAFATRGCRPWLLTSTDVIPPPPLPPGAGGLIAGINGIAARAGGLALPPP